MGDIEIRKEDLQRMIDSMPITVVAKEVGVSTQTVYKLIGRHGLVKRERSTRGVGVA